LPLTVAVPVLSTVEQVVSLWAYRWKVTVPVGELPPLNTAWSSIVPPTKTPGEAVVTIVGLDTHLGIVRSSENEFELPSVVWLDVQADEATTLPARPGMAIVNDAEFNGKDTSPVVVVVAPPVGV
jgi:hypothetical protein